VPKGFEFTIGVSAYYKPPFPQRRHD
jgi:hypothetical protein